MRDKYLKYYGQYSHLAPFVFVKDAFFSKDKWRRLALLHRQKDYMWLGKNRNYLSLHLALNEILLRGQNWVWHDYGEGYFYQGFRMAGITGFRDTEARIAVLGLNKLVRGKRVLNIGCNTAFLDIIIAKEACYVESFDINPYLIEVANKTSNFFSIANLSLSVKSFEDYESEDKFDVVLSFANHSTYDGNTKQSLVDYFRKCASHVGNNGIFVFESHPLNYESVNALRKTTDIISSIFNIRKLEALNYGTIFDHGRTYILAETG